MPKTTVTYDQLDQADVDAGIDATISAKDPVEDDTLTTPPGSPALGERHIIAGLGGAWAGFALGDIVTWNGAAWDRWQSKVGDQCFVKAVEKVKVFNGLLWELTGGGATSLGDLADVGSDSPTAGNILVANGTQFSATPHETLNDLGHDVMGPYFVEITRLSGRVSSVIHWTSAAKTQRIREVTVGRNAQGRAATLTFKAYDQAGLLTHTETITISRDTGTQMVQSGTASYV